MQRLYDLMVVLALPIAIVVSLGSPIIIALLYGDTYADSAAILAVHVWTGPFVFMAAILSKWLIAEDHLVFSFVRHGTGAAINVILNLWWIPAWSGLGAAFATLASYAMASYLACFIFAPARPQAKLMTRALLLPARTARGLMRLAEKA